MGVGSEGTHPWLNSKSMSYYDLVGMVEELLRHQLAYNTTEISNVTQ